MVSTPTVSNSSVDMSLKGEFFNTGKHQEPPFFPAKFFLPSQTNNMLYIGVSVFTANSAAFVYNKAGVLSLYITDDMVSNKASRNTEVKLSIPYYIYFHDFTLNNFLQLFLQQIPRTITICLNTTAFEVFLPKDTSVNAQLFLSGMRLAGAVTLNKMNLTLGTSYMGQFQVKALSSFLQQVLKVVLIPTLNGEFLYSQVYINRALSVLHVVIC
ncbi:bactericidal permeability-increasing protein-like isoform X1 [Betta splendens]|uniref:Bactericidal permeability-increasing protein n=1 Tax=Betta splendens TaxID=158456 RepID=A0A9W2XRZ9_BETSP|nr:bactericidal permeability-increasing protein-like isoform X1 [Betta splendens]